LSGEPKAEVCDLYADRQAQPLLKGATSWLHNPHRLSLTQ
jgi:hypothetical protein